MKRQNELSQTFSKVANGLKDAIDWYDVPIAVAFYNRAQISRTNFGNCIVLDPTPFEQSLSNSIGDKNNSTLGSMDKDILPDMVFYSRLSTNLVLDLFTDANITQKNYKDVFLFRKSLIYTYTLTEYIKSFVYRKRPDETDSRSFISGHTSTTFAAATYLYLELDDFFDGWDVTRRNDVLKNVLKVGSTTVLYGWASFVGYSRLRDKKHYLSDVISGAIVGSLISYIVYTIHREDEPGLFNNFNLISNNEDVALSFRLGL
ncbi:MAG: phosphatase PAP2 family protein [Ignavibacteria bacterium]